MTWTGSADRLTVQPVHRVGRPLIGSLRVQVPVEHETRRPQNCADRVESRTARILHVDLAVHES